MSFKLRNLTYQPFRIMVGTNCQIIPPRGKRGEIIVKEKTPQIENLERRELIKIREIKD